MAFLFKTIGWRILPLGVLALGSSCRPLTDAWTVGWTESRAKDRIMLVREQPVTLGYRRLVSQSGVYPDLGAFLHLRGMPDFLAESTASRKHFLILYYLENRTAFACRAKGPDTRFIEFAGPYPITEREHQTLSGLKTESNKAAAGR